MAKNVLLLAEVDAAKLNQFNWPIRPTTNLTQSGPFEYPGRTRPPGAGDKYTTRVPGRPFCLQDY